MAAFTRRPVFPVALLVLVLVGVPTLFGHGSLRDFVLVLGLPLALDFAFESGRLAERRRHGWS